jgi:acyl-CoA synthetase (AMP-forming)/AMP-acid ligase II
MAPRERRPLNGTDVAATRAIPAAWIHPPHATVSSRSFPPPAADAATVPFFSALESHGDRVALLLPDGSGVSYRDLAARADAYGARYHGEGRLLAIAMHNDIESIAAYLGALRHGCPAILMAEGSTAPEHPIMAAFRPETVVAKGAAGWLVETRHEVADPAGLHPDLGVMLSTSGTTGSPKLVKLSRENLHENARSIAEYLGLDPERRAITNLPLHYSYGLSVLNSHLLAGGSVVLTERSVVEEEFWQVFRREQVTDLPGVPYTYELFEKIGLRSDPPPSLRVMTQAGGRLPPQLVSDYARFARERGIRFFVMYGQTEATARMAYLPPELTLENSDCIGVAIPRGNFEIRGEDGTAITVPGVSGELVYRGPNVMMGYGLKREDLAAPRQLVELATQDIAQWTSAGLVKIVGRSSRFSKIAGLRVGLDDIERILREAGRKAYAAGTDDFIAVALVDGSEPAEARQLLSQRCKLPPHCLAVFAVETAPTLASGKIDYVTIRMLGEEVHRKESAEALADDDPVRALFAKALGRGQVGQDASFAGLGGDSLSYMIVSRGLETMLGHLPQHWERLSVRDLNRLREEQALAPRAPVKSLTVSIDVVLRLIAISTIFIGHGAPGHTMWLRGGTAVLFCLAGYSLCRFQREQLLAGRVLPAITGAFRRIVIPYLLVMTALMIATHLPPHVSWWTLTSVFFIDTFERGILFSYWFIEALLHCLLIVCGLFLVPPVRRWMAAQPFASGMAVALAGVAAFFAGRHLFGSESFSHKFDGWLYIYMIGWTFALAREAWQKAVLIALGSAVAVLQFGPETSRPYWFIAGLLALALIRDIRLPRRVGAVVSQVAAASYMAYLCHPVVLHFTKFVLPTRHDAVVTMLLTYFGTLGAGLAAAWSWQWLTTRALDLFKRNATNPAADATAG